MKTDADPSLGWSGSTGDGVTKASAQAGQCQRGASWVGGCDGAHPGHPAHWLQLPLLPVQGGDCGMTVVTASSVPPAISTGWVPIQSMI